jgi:integrase
VTWSACWTAATAGTRSDPRLRDYATGRQGTGAGDPAGPGQRCHYRACDRAGLPRIGAHRLRHTLATKCDAKIAWKALSKRIGHADVAFTMKQYVQTDLEADRQVANTLAQLTIGGSLTSIAVADEAGDTSEGAA